MRILIQEGNPMQIRNFLSVIRILICIQLASWIRIRILDADPDPGSQSNANPELFVIDSDSDRHSIGFLDPDPHSECGSGSKRCKISQRKLLKNFSFHYTHQKKGAGAASE
jgi:hypothetical protein